MTNREQPELYQSDPGDGWRLLWRGEVVLRGDQCKRGNDDWIDVPNPGYVYSSGLYWPHRRRIPIDAPQPDLVSAPPHYRQGDIECIDAIRAALTPEEFRGFCKGNVIKYTWRERHKAGNADLKKCGDYLNYATSIKTKVTE